MTHQKSKHKLCAQQPHQIWLKFIKKRRLQNYNFKILRSPSRKKYKQKRKKNNIPPRNRAKTKNNNENRNNNKSLDELRAGDLIKIRSKTISSFKSHNNENETKTVSLQTNYVRKTFWISKAKKKHYTIKPETNKNNKRRCKPYNILSGVLFTSSFWQRRFFVIVTKP